jgi:hypothetical protein
MKYITSIILLGLIYMIGCETPQDLNRPGDSLSGAVWMIDTNIMLNGGYYTVSFRTDSLDLVHLAHSYDTPFHMTGIPPGRFFLAATWSSYPRIQNEVPIVLGTYGCDTSRNCTNHQVIVFPNYDGVGRFFYCWTDLSKRLN